VEPTTNGENLGRVSPASNSVDEIVRNPVFHAVRFVLNGWNKKLPAVAWLQTDGNVYSVTGTAIRAWRRTDRDVAERLGSLINDLMAGRTEDADETRAAILRGFAKEAESGDGYRMMLGLCIGVTSDNSPDLSEDDEEWEEEEEEEEDSDE
jgi:hypothetical protein